MAEEDKPVPVRKPAPVRRKTPLKLVIAEPPDRGGAARASQPAGPADKARSLEQETKARLPKPSNKKRTASKRPKDVADNRGQNENSKATRFKDGNKHGRGRPKGSKNASTLAREVLDKVIVLGGEPQTVRELAFMQQATKAGRGELKPLLFLLETEGKDQVHGPGATTSENEPLSDSESAALEEYYRMLFQKEKRQSR